MTTRWVYWVTLFSTVGAGLVAGIFFVFSNFLMRVLDRRPPADAVATMQLINERIVNPLFMLFFAGTALAGAVLAGYGLFRLTGAERALLVAGGVIYVVGVFFVTVGYHVPRNDTLAKVNASGPDAARAWATYMSEWLPAHHLRTVAAVASFVSFAVALRTGRRA